MGKIVKYCSACEEGFAEKFSFCPNCANELTAFEMKPVAEKPIEEDPPALEVDDEPILETQEPIKTESIAEAPTEKIDEEISLTVDEPETVDSETVFEPVSFEQETPETKEEIISSFDANDESPTEEFVTNEGSELEEQTFEESNDTAEEAYVAAETVDDAEVIYDDFKSTVTSEDFTSVDSVEEEDLDDGGYHITVIKEKGVKQRNMLLLGSATLMITLTLAGVVYSIFTSPLLVGAIGDDGDLISLVEVDEKPIDPDEPEKKKDDDEGGGGGGGGKNEKTETSKGRLATQMKKPQFAPTARAVKLTNPDIKITRATEGEIKRPPTDEPYGNPNSKSTLTSDGKGSGGGMGSGVGTGQGSGRGTGEGSGIGSGSGSGIGDGIGSGRGSGRGSGVSKPPPTPRPTPKPPAGPTVGIKILSKPRPGYTDSARTNNVQGTVMLRVTFLANGRVGGVSAVKGLPHGLTAKAISAARQIRFKPAMRNGQPYSVTKRIQYNFTIY